MSGSVESRRPEKKKRQRLTVEMETVAESSDRISPVLGYFPSGYNADNPDAPPPAVRLFRNTRRSNRLELVVSPPAANVDFVGTSYSGEAAGPQICTYALGVLDKDTQTLKIVPIAANKIFRLEPKVIRAPEAEDAAAEEGISVERSRADLTGLYGTKKNKSKDKVWKTLKQQQHDPSTRENMDIQASEADINNEPSQEVKGTVTRNIPPYDPSAVVPEKAYLLDEIILKAEWDYLTDILEFIQSGADAKSGFWQENDYPSYVISRIHMLKEIQVQEETEKLACILSFISYLIKFWKVGKCNRSRAFPFPSSVGHSHKIPRIIFQRFMRTFVDPVSDTVSAEHKELLIGYILVLTLFADKFVVDPTEIAKDLGVPHEDLLPYYWQLGCKGGLDPSLRKYRITLPVPLKLKEEKKRRRRRQ